MTKFLASGRRRDLCVILAGAGELNGQALKSRLESHYGERIEPRSFYGALEALVDAGFVEAREAGVHDVYALTGPGDRRLRDHYGWMGEHVGADDAGSDGDTGDGDGDGQ
jgi:DNA-binding PadR family transcriptional regulator